MSWLSKCLLHNYKNPEGKGEGCRNETYKSRLCLCPDTYCVILDMSLCLSGSQFPPREKGSRI